MLLSLLGSILAAFPASAATGDRTLYLYFTHTNETGKFTFRKNGRYDPAVLAQLNVFLRDWRRDESTKMDPALFDLVWEVYQAAGATGPIHVVSAYRAPQTNEMLRSRSSAVAKNSRHTMGMAMDFFIPSVPLAKLRAIAMREQVGGVGYYPTSGSPFVHLDTGNVRAWPRMTRAQLEKLFPKGETLHLPVDGTPLSEKGYQLAKNEWLQCHAVPCTNRSTNATIRLAQNTDGQPSGKGSLLGWLFGTDNNEEGDLQNDTAPGATVTTVAQVSPAQISTAAPAITPIPAARPVSLYARPDAKIPFGIGSDPLVPQALAVAEIAPRPQTRPAWLAAPTDTIAVASIAQPAPAPDRHNLLEPAIPVLSAYAPVAAPQPDAQRAVQIILDRRAAETKSSNAELNTTGQRTNLGSANPDVGALAALLTGTMQAVGDRPHTLAPEILQQALKGRTVEFTAPDLARVVEIFVNPAALSSDRFAVIVDHDRANFSPVTELGRFASNITTATDPAFGLGVGRFRIGKSLLIAAR